MAAALGAVGADEQRRAGRPRGRPALGYAAEAAQDGVAMTIDLLSM
jgi:hypothetical protein